MSLEVVLFWVAVGVVVGWTWPQPAWAKSLWAKVKGWFTN